MKKYIFLIFTVCFIASCYNQTVKSQAVKLKLLKQTSAVYKTPESVIYNPKKNELYVSNINGNPNRFDANGFISKMDKDGNVIQREWITGLNAPKGMAIWQNYLFVTDIDRIVKIDIDSSKIVGSYKLQNAKFLNDMTVDASGNIYISDMIGNKIYKFKDGKAQVWIASGLNSPNGMECDNRYLYIGNGGYLLQVNLQTKETKMLYNKTGVIDGLKKDKYGNFLVSDWLGNISLLANGKRTIIKKAKPKINAADFELINDTLYVPTFIANSVEIYKVEYPK